MRLRVSPRFALTVHVKFVFLRLLQDHPVELSRQKHAAAVAFHKPKGRRDGTIRMMETAAPQDRTVGIMCSYPQLRRGIGSEYGGIKSGDIGANHEQP
jgi:hypothetical protein